MIQCSRLPVRRVQKGKSVVCNGCMALGYYGASINYQPLRSSLYQPDGTSRPGTDWVLVLRNGNAEKRILVRIYADRTPRQSPEEHAAAAISYTSQLINGGSLSSSDSEPNQIVVPDEFVAVDVPPSVGAKPWWKFW